MCPRDRLSAIRKCRGGNRLWVVKGDLLKSGVAAPVNHLRQDVGHLDARSGSGLAGDRMSRLKVLEERYQESSG